MSNYEIVDSRVVACADEGSIRKVDLGWSDGAPGPTIRTDWAWAIHCESGTHWLYLPAGQEPTDEQRAGVCTVASGGESPVLEAAVDREAPTAPDAPALAPPKRKGKHGR